MKKSVWYKGSYAKYEECDGREYGMVSSYVKKSVATARAGIVNPAS